MSVSAGQTVYNHGKPPCSGSGIAWNSDELDEAIKGPVVATLFDERGKDNFREMLAGIPETEFEQEALEEMLDDSSEIENWRVGEAIAETYLTHHRSCVFPWPDSRDERNRRSSLPGADLVGFGVDHLGDSFAFGEVKTSNDKKYPPSLMYGRTGLKQQLEGLRNKQLVRRDLFLYLGYRAKHSDFWLRFQAASKRYLKNSSDVQIFGVLIRDVQPDVNDIQARVNMLAKNCPEGTSIELLAIYLPLGEIAELSHKAVLGRKRSAT